MNCRMLIFKFLLYPISSVLQLDQRSLLEIMGKQTILGVVIKPTKGL